MSKRLQDGQWFTVATKEQHDCLKRYGQLNPPRNPWAARVQIGTWAGPGRCLMLSYTQRCPRNCCDDDVRSVLSAEEVLASVREEMRDLAELLKQAKESS